MSNTTTPSGIGTLSGIVLDCSDTFKLAEFYAALSGWPVHTDSDKDWAAIETPLGDRIALAFQRVDEYVPPKWPTTDPPQQFHLDFNVADLDAGEKEVLAIGAVRADHQPGTSFRVFLDPEGHPFCLCKD